MSLGLALNNAVSGLRVNQQSLAVLSQNISNVNTPGYSRQVVEQSANFLYGVGNGVQIDDIGRKVDTYLQRSVINQGSINTAAQTTSDYYARLQSILGRPGASNSIDTYLTTFFNSLQALSDQPETPSSRSSAVTAGVTLADQISGLASGIMDLRFQADRDISESVTKINETIDNLTSINVAISTTQGLGGSTAGLLDKRDEYLRTLSTYMDISVSEYPTGAVTVTAGNGVAIVDGGTRHQLQYSSTQSSEAFVQDASLNQLSVITYDDKGKVIGNPAVLITSGKSADVTANLSSGKLASLQQIRDKFLPETLSQLDELASQLRDAMNAIQNSGSGFPPATSYTGERLIDPTQSLNWAGQVRIAALNSDGTPVSSGYADESYTGQRPLTLDLSALDSGNGAAAPTTQAIIDEINNHFSAPGNKVELGNINNIQLASDTSILPSGAQDFFNFDLDLENISGKDANLFVQGITVTDSTGTDITNVTQGAPQVSLNASQTYTTSAGSSQVQVAMLSLPPGLKQGDTIYLGSPSVANVDGIPASNLTGYFTVQGVVGNSIIVDTGVAAATGAVVNDTTPAMAMGAYTMAYTGQEIRSKNAGQFQVDLSSSSGSAYYTITLNVATRADDGTMKTSQISYRVNNNESNLLNKRYSAISANNNGTIVPPITTQDTIHAIMVDAKGVELPKINGQYTSQSGYLKLVGGNGVSIAIDSLDSRQQGVFGDPSDNGTNYGFSQYFGLNNFFSSNGPTASGDTLKNSAINLKVRDTLKNDPNQISIGALVLQRQPADANSKPQYTYVRYSGDNNVAQAMAKLSSSTVKFNAAGGLPTTQLSLSSYSSQLLGYVSAQSASATGAADTAQTLFDSFQNRATAVSGVNLDEELANTISLQNAYAATAKIVTVVNTMYESLLQSF